MGEIKLGKLKRQKKIVRWKKEKWVKTATWRGKWNQNKNENFKK